MSKKLTLLLALALMLGLVVSSNLAATEGAAAPLGIEAASSSLTLEQRPAACAAPEALSPLFTAPVFTTPVFVDFEDCVWGASCRTRRDCGLAGYCEIQYGGWGVCGCY